MVVPDPLEEVKFCPRCGKESLEKIKTILVVKAACTECKVEFSVEISSMKEPLPQEDTAAVEKPKRIIPDNPAWKYIDRQDN